MPDWNPLTNWDQPLCRRSVLRGAGNSDLPNETAVSSITVPTLILAWTGDPGHPVSTALRLHELIPSSQLSIAESVAKYLAWGQLAAEFLDGKKGIYQMTDVLGF